MIDQRKLRVVVTGGAGKVARAFASRYAEHYELVMTDAKEFDAPGAQTVFGELSDTALLARMMEGADVVVHLAAASAPHEPWERVLPNNIDGVYNVFEAARAAGVGRVVYASSTHACAGEVKVSGRVGPDAPVRPDCLYGVSKAFGEALGRYYADRFGLSVICLRIGGLFGPEGRDEQRAMFERLLERDTPPQHPYRAWQLVAIWISGRDMAQLLDRSIRVERVPFGIFYGASANEPELLDLSETRRVLGYAPQDAAQDILGRPIGPRPAP